MKRLLFGVILFLVLMIGFVIGYFAFGTHPATTFFTTTTAISIANLRQEIEGGCKYLESNYNASLGLISETTNHQRYFLYSDNFLALLVLSKDCGRPDLANKINETLSQYNSSKIPNQYMVFECKYNFEGSKNYNFSDHVSTTVNNMTGPLLKDSYADIVFLNAYYDEFCNHNLPGALTAFNIGASEYDGIGFNDTAFRVGPSEGTYQTYKLALYITVAKLLNQTVPTTVLLNMAMMQSPDGGFYTGYSTRLSLDGVLTNTETTSLAIMALRAVVGT